MSNVRVSSFCSAGGCVRVEFTGTGVIVGSTTSSGSVLFDHAEWEAFLAGAKDGEFDRPGVSWCETAPRLAQGGNR